MPPLALFDLLADPRRGALEDLLDPSVTFHSPVADYAGRADVAHLLAMVPAIARDLTATRVLTAPGERATLFTARVGDRPVTGALHERAEAGRVVEATLMLRPFAQLRDAVRAMGAALAAAPLPSAA